MGAISSFERIVSLDLPVADEGGTASIGRYKDYHIQVQATAADTLDVNAAIDTNIQAVEGIMYATVTGVYSGTSNVTSSGTYGTALVFNTTGKQRLGIRVSLKE